MRHDKAHVSKTIAYKTAEAEDLVGLQSCYASWQKAFYLTRYDASLRKTYSSRKPRLKASASGFAI